MSERERALDHPEGKKALTAAPADGTLLRKLLLLYEVSKIYKLIDFVSFKLKTLCDNEKF